MAETEASNKQEWDRAKQEGTIRCRDGCGKEVPLSEASKGGWLWLPIQGRWRCIPCHEALTQANKVNAGVGG